MARGGSEAPERPVGELFEQLVDDGRAYAKAEAELVRAKVEHRVARYRTAAVLAGIALTFGIGAAVALALTLVLSLASLIGPLAGGLTATLIIGAVAALAGFQARKAFDRAGR